MKIIVSFPRSVTFLIFLAGSGIGMLVTNTVMKTILPPNLLENWLFPNSVLAVGFDTKSKMEAQSGSENRFWGIF